MNSNYTKSVFAEHISSTIPVSILYPTIPDQEKTIPLINNEKQVNFLSINRFERKKDLALALRSFAHLRQSIPSSLIHLYIIGGYDQRLKENVEYYRELEQLAEELQLDSTMITFVRSFSDDEKREYLSKAHCLLYTPRFEHFGIVPLEGMQAGRPVIATATGGPLETILDGQTGYLCDEPLVETFAERMKIFVEDRNRWKEMGDAGRRHVKENFSFQPFARKLNEHVEELLEKNIERSFSLLFTLLALIVIVFISYFLF